MVIVGGLGSIWGVLLGALLLSYINQYLIPDVLNGIPGDLGLNFSLTDIGLGIYGFLLVLVMVLRPAGPAARAKTQARAGRGRSASATPSSEAARRSMRSRLRGAGSEPCAPERVGPAGADGHGDGVCCYSAPRT